MLHDGLRAPLFYCTVYIIITPKHRKQNPHNLLNLLSFLNCEHLPAIRHHLTTRIDTCNHFLTCFFKIVAFHNYLQFPITPALKYSQQHFHLYHMFHHNMNMCELNLSQYFPNYHTHYESYLYLLD